MSDNYSDQFEAMVYLLEEDERRKAGGSGRRNDVHPGKDAQPGQDEEPDGERLAWRRKAGMQVAP